MTAEDRNCTRDESRRWSFRGYELDPANFTSAMVHLYRGEIQRANTWRTRLDATTNWAVITVAGALTFVFAEPTNPHFVFGLVLLLLLVFLTIEARRYRYYVLWAYRVHLMETDFLAPIFVPPFQPSADWAGKLAQTLSEPSFPIKLWQAVARRFRRNYIWLMSLLVLSWVLKLVMHPTRTGSITTVVERATVGPIRGQAVVLGAALLYTGLFALMIVDRLSRSWFPAPEFLRRVTRPFVPRPRREERLAVIVTTEGQAVAGRILRELQRGVTALEGKGMYTGDRWDVLLSAVTDVQVSHLKAIVHEIDAHAFVVVSMTAEIRGGGFTPFEPPS